MYSKRDKWIYLGFLVPSLLLFCFVILFPFISGINIAFTDWDGISRGYKYVFFDNFERLFHDKGIVNSIKNTLVFAFSYTALNNIIALTLAVFLDKVRAKNALKTVFFIPLALSPVLASFVWRFIDKNVVAELLGTNSLLGNPSMVILGIVIIALWNNIGSNLMIYIAGIINISKDYYEAAEIEGASEWQTFRYIVLPLLVPSFTLCITLTLTSSLREFATVMAATGGGPAKKSETVAIYIYRNLFSYEKAGYGQAVGLVFMFVLVTVGIILNRFFRNREVEL